MTASKPEHKDPQWWTRLPPVATSSSYPLDICSYCGHIRILHTENGCSARSASLYDGTACACTNRISGSLYKQCRSVPAKGRA